MPFGKKTDNIFQNLDKWEYMKQGRMAFLLDEIEAAKEIEVSKFLGVTAVKYGIREATGREYIRDWENAGCISVRNGVIKFVRKLD
jgi:hypothetical protein